MAFIIRRIAQKLILFLIMSITLTSCKTALMKQSTTLELADKNASSSTKYLMQRIKEISKTGYAIGHQDATAYGLDWKNDGTIYKSDINDVTGDFPAVYGFELGHLELGHEQNLDSVNFKLMAELIKKAHSQGGIITLSWHPDNPVTKESAWDPSPAVSHILEGQLLNPKYQAWLTKVAEFIKNLKTSTGEPIPVVFRPYHEMNGSWFWWGHGNCTPEEFKILWKQTFEFFTQKHQVNNLLYCYSTDAVKSEEEYLKYYPGDNYVDLLGMDLYHKNSTEEYIKLLNSNLNLLAKLGTEKNKPYAMTEGGMNMVSVENWWTEVLHKNVMNKGIAWALFWRNAWPNHYFAPFNGQKSSTDFKELHAKKNVLFLKDVSKIK